MYKVKPSLNRRDKEQGTAENAFCKSRIYSNENSCFACNSKNQFRGLSNEYMKLLDKCKECRIGILFGYEVSEAVSNG